MQTLPKKNYSVFGRRRQLVLPMDAEVMIQAGSPVRLLRWMLEGFDMRPLETAWEDYCAEKRARYYERKRKMEEKDKEERMLLEIETRANSLCVSKGRDKQMTGRQPVSVIEILSIILYAYMRHIYSSRKQAEACRENINFLWLLNGKAAPSRELLNAFRKHVLGKTIEPLFYELVKFLERVGEINFKNVFIDGTKLEANANKYSYVWRKNIERYESGVCEKVETLIKIINERDEVKLYFNKEKYKRSIAVLTEYVNGKLEAAEKADKERIKELKIWRKILKESAEKLAKYAEMRVKLGKRNSYSKTDTDATFFRMKDKRLLPAYNAQIAVEGEYITGCDIFQYANDINTLEPFLDHIYEMTEHIYKNVIADAGYESEENYVYLEKQKQKTFIKPVNYKQSKKKKFKNDISKRDNMKYDANKDEYTCANNKQLKVVKVEKLTNKRGYEKEITHYECENCALCPVREKCTKAKEGNRTVQVSKRLLEKRAVSKANIESDEGKLLRVNRSIQAEGAFGVTKENYHFRRFLTRKKEGVRTELFLLCFAYNINKLHNKIQNERLGPILHPLKRAA